MFAVAPIEKGEEVLKWGGTYVSATKAKKEIENGKLVMQWDENLFSVEDKGDDDGYFINHSCDPNLWMSDAFTLVARRDIKTKEEITADYCLWEADKSYIASWDCNCGSPLCRKKIKGTDWQLKSLQEKYSDHFSSLLNKRMKRQK